MAGILSICKVSVGAAPGGKDYYFRGSSMYSEISAETGVTVIAPKDWNNEEPLIQIGALLVSGKVERLVAPITVSTANGDTTRYVSLIVAKDKVSTIQNKGALAGKKYKIIKASGTVSTVGVFDNEARQKASRVRTD
jgi:hypothetical protein